MNKGISMKNLKRIFATALVGLVCAGAVSAHSRGWDGGRGYGPCHDNYDRRNDGFGPRRDGLDRRSDSFGPRHNGLNRRGDSFGPRRDSPDRSDDNYRPRRNAAGETVTVSGNLALVDGQIAVIADGITYIAGGLRWLIGFIDGLKEGAAVSLEGWARTSPFNPDTRLLRISKLTVDGKDYTFPIR
jgi:hypothetical protein